MQLSKIEIFHRTWPLVVATGMGALTHYHLQLSKFNQFLLHRQMDWLAHSDGLTNLNNRRAFNEHLSKCLALAKRDNLQIALVLLDVDYFKRFNDCYGHEAGDQALISIAKVLQDVSVRELDMAARTGGEEMALILHDINFISLKETISQISKSISDLKIPHEYGVNGQISVSVGVATSLKNDNPKDLYIRADRLLYASKNSGRARATYEFDNP
ncbi:GGDEF domain-containing protein [Ideonella paludis]|uniref:GGDEF domain-containing protein n=1 Tax=Ideonella paludis TaxID=1233411 RepID=UPI00363BC0A1